MGMAASQARLLSITTRLTNNELQSQMITNSKLRLAEKSSEASEEYMEALDTQKLMYGYYDDNGDKSYTALTANTLLTYGDLKNQYALVNSAGKIMLNGSDIKNYEASATMADFLYCYGVEKVDNPDYIQELTDLFGDDYAKLFDADNPYQYTRNSDGTALDYLKYFGNTVSTIDIDSISESKYNSISSQFSTYLANAGMSDSSLYGGTLANLVEKLNSMPAYVAPASEPDLLDYAKALLSPQCWDNTGIANLRTGDYTSTSNTNIWHMEHVLSQYLFSDYEDSFTVNINGTDETITNTGNTWALSDGGGSGSDPMDVRGVLDKKENAELKQQLQELYYQICLHIDTNNTSGGLTSGSITNNGGNTVMSNEEIAELYMELINQLLLAVATDILEAGESDSRYSELSNYTNALEAYNNYIQFQSEFAAWTASVTSAIESFEDAIENLSDPLIPDSTDSKYQWYVNLWYRMGAGATNSDGTKNNSNYQEIDSSLINNSEWLQFCFEHGILTLEKAEFSADGSATYPGMGYYDWVSTIYTNATDITSQDDEVAIAKAEAKYTKTMNEIEAKDKSYDQDLKDLDTEHTALQTEYDSLKEVISKNVERSFKAFS